MTTNEATTIELYNPQGTPTKTRKIIPAQKRARKDTETSRDANQTCTFEFTGQEAGVLG
jgi:hypothetical protein